MAKFAQQVPAWMQVVLVCLLFCPVLTLPAAELAPVLVGHYPADGATGVPTNTTCLIGLVPNWSGFVELTLFQGENRIDSQTNYLLGQARQLVPKAPLTPSMRYRVEVSYGLAALGLSYSFEFTTGAGPDTTGPRFTKFDPEPGQLNSQSGVFTIWFDKPLQMVGNAIEVRDAAGFQKSFNTSLTSDFRGIIVTPESTSNPPNGYTVRVDPSMIRDAAGNAGQGGLAQATYRANSALPAPKLIAMFPARGQDNVPTNVGVQILFDNPIQEPRIEAGIRWVDESGTNVPFTASTFTGYRGILLRPRALLRAGATYRISSTTALLGSQSQPVEPFESSFSVGQMPDLEEPGYTRSPAFGAIPLNPVLSFRSDKAITNIAAAGTVQFGSIPGRLQLSPDGRVFTIRPERPLRPLTRYVVTLPELFDATGAAIPFGLLEFTTGTSEDHAAPRVVGIAPPDDATGIPPDSSLKIQFDEPVSLPPDKEAVTLLRGDTVVRAKADISYPAKVLDIIPETPLAENAEYRLVLNGVVDYAGNTSATASARFTTGASSGRVPAKLVRTSPEKGAGQVGLKTPVVFEFDRPIMPVLPEGAVQAESPGQQSIAVDASVSGSQVIVTPGGEWPPNAPVRVRVSIPDFGFYNMAGEVAFTTSASEDKTPAAVEAAEPAPGSALSSDRPVIRLRFSERVLPASISDKTLVALSDAGPVKIDTSVDPDARAASIVFPSGLDRPVSIYALPGITDPAGNALTPFEGSWTIRAVLDGPYRPQIAQSRPPSAFATMVSPDSGITLILQMAMPLSQFESIATVLADSVPVRGKWRTLYDPRVFRFEPDTPFPSDSQVVLSLYNSSELRFRVWRSGGNNPVPVRLNFIDRQIEPGDFIEAEFDRDFSDPTGLLGLVSQGKVVEAKATRVRPRVVRLTPAAPLDPKSFYTVVLGPRAASYRFADNLDRDWDLRFAEAKESAATPVLRNVYPVANSSNIPLNAQISVAYSAAINATSVIPETVQVRAAGRILSGSFRVWPLQSGFTFTPWEVLPPDTRVQVDINGLEDRAGHPIPQHSFEFRTGSQLDLFAPTVLQGGGRQEEIVAGAQQRILFSEAVSPEILDSFLNSPSGPSDFVRSAELSPDLRLLTLVVTPDAPRGREVSLRLSDVSDGAGNKQNSVFMDATVALDADSTQPRLLSLFPADSLEGIPRNVMLTAVFSENIATSFPLAVRLYRDGQEVPLVPVASRVSAILKARPVTPLSPFTRYDVVVEGARDAAGNRLDGRFSRTFTTSGNIDAVAPSVIRGVSGMLPLSMPPVVQFSEPVVPATLEGRIILSAAGASERVLPAEISLQPDGRTLTIQPKGGVQPGMYYRVTLDSGIEDYAGNALDFSWSQEFAAAYKTDGEPPRAIVSPQDGTTEVPVSATVRIVFNEPVQLAPDERNALQLLRGDHVWPGVVSISPASFEFRPYVALDPSSTYTIRVAAVADLSGNALPAATTSFVTSDSVSLPGTRFSLVSTEPAFGAADVPLDTSVRFNFNRPPDPTTAMLRLSAENYYIPGTVAVVQNSIVFTPSAPLPPLTQITAGFEVGGAVMDLSGQRAQGVPFVSFTTRAGADTTAPKLLSILPESGTVLSPGRRTFAMRFSEPVQNAFEGIRVLGGATTLRPDRMSTGEDPTEIYIDIDVPPDSVLTIAATAALRDFAGNRAEPFSVQYPTETGGNKGTSSPSVTSIQPAEYSRVPAGRQPVTIHFNRRMNAPSVLSSVRVTQNGALIGGQTEMIEDDRAVRFTPDLPFEAGAQIQVFVLVSATDSEGFALPQRYSAWFYIEGTSSSAMEILHTSLVNGNAPLGTIAVEFDRPLAARTIHEGTVWISNAGGNARVPARIALEGDRVIVVTPDQTLDPGRQWRLTITAGVQDSTGQPWRGRDILFRAEPASPDPALDSVTAEEGGSNTVIRVRFAGAVNPLQAHRLRLLREDGLEVPFNVRYSLTGDEWTLVPIWPPREGTSLRVVMPDATTVRVSLPRKPQ